MSVKFWLPISLAFGVATGAGAALLLRPETTPFLSPAPDADATGDRVQASGPNDPTANRISLPNGDQFQVRFEDDLLTERDNSYEYRTRGISRVEKPAGGRPGSTAFGLIASLIASG